MQLPSAHFQKVTLLLALGNKDLLLFPHVKETSAMQKLDPQATAASFYINIITIRCKKSACFARCVRARQLLTFCHTHTRYHSKRYTITFNQDKTRVSSISHASELRSIHLFYPYCVAGAMRSARRSRATPHAAGAVVRPTSLRTSRRCFRCRRARLPTSTRPAS